MSQTHPDTANAQNPAASGNPFADGLLALRQGDFARAADLAQSVLRTSPGQPQAWVLLCTALIRMGSRDDERALRDALAQIPPQDPAHPMLAVELSRVLGRHGRTGESAALVRRLQHDPRLSPRDHSTLSHALATAGLFEEALEHARRATASLPEDAGARYNLALALRYLGRLTEAEAEFERVLSIMPRHALAHFTLADTRRWTPENNHLSRLREAIADPDLADADRTKILYAAFKEAHDCGLTDEAWEFLSRATALAANVQPYPTGERRRFHDALIATFRGDLAGPAAPPADRPTPVFIVGLPRSGTTLVERILAAHPDVTAMGETHGFPIALRDSIGVPRLTEIDSEAVSMMAAADREAVAGRYLANVGYLLGPTRFFTEKLPHNYLYVGAIRRAFPEARIVHLRRNPMDSLFGAYKILFGEASYLWSYRFEDLAENYRLYRRITDHWRAELGEGFTEVTLERLIDEPEREIRRLLDALGLPFDPACLAPHKTGGGVSTASSAQVRQPINRQGVDAWRRYRTQFEPLRAELQRDGFVDDDGNAVWG